MENEIKYLSVQECEKLMPTGDSIHVFLNPNGMLIGADWSRNRVIEMLSLSKPQLSGEHATKMNHGIACFHDERWHFVETTKTGEV